MVGLARDLSGIKNRDGLLRFRFTALSHLPAFGIICASGGRFSKGLIGENHEVWFTLRTIYDKKTALLIFYKIFYFMLESR